MNCSRKGDATISTLGTLIIAVAVLIVVIAIIVVIAARSDEATQNTLCRASVILRGKARVDIVKGVYSVEKITPIACRTRNLGTLKGDRETIKQKIAARSARCWWQFAEGSVQDLFKKDYKENACFVCYTFNIPDNLDNGTESRMNFFNEGTRSKTEISSAEIMNYLASTAYNPAIIYGGGTKNYFGANYTFKIDTGSEGAVMEEMRPRDFDSKLVSGYVLDYAYMLTPETKDRLEQIGIGLQEKKLANLLVITADEFSSMDRSDARTIIENTRLNTNETTYDGLLVILDLKNRMVRVHAGSDLSAFIKEYDVAKILGDEFGKAEDASGDCPDRACMLQEVNKALLSSMERINSRLNAANDMLPGVNPRSYYYYISNGGLTWSIVDNIKAKQTYVIAYVGVSDSVSGETIKRIINGITSTVNTVLFDVGSIVGYNAFDVSKDRSQNILITDVNSVGNECTQVV
jgi:hypothetical protein